MLRTHIQMTHPEEHMRVACLAIVAGVFACASLVACDDKQPAKPAAEAKDDNKDKAPADKAGADKAGADKPAADKPAADKPPADKPGDDEAQDKPDPDRDKEEAKQGSEKEPEPLDPAILAEASKADDTMSSLLPSPGQVLSALSLLGGGDTNWAALVGDARVTAADDRATTALRVGVGTTDFFVFVHAKDAAKAKSLGEQLLTAGEKLGVGGATKDKGPALMAALDKGDWHGVTATMDEIYAGIRAHLAEEMADEDTALLVGAGAWLEGIRIATAHLKDNYDDTAANLLRQHFVASYLSKRLEPLAAKSEAVKTVSGQLGELAKAMEVERDAGVPKDKVVAMHTALTEVVGQLKGAVQ